MTAKLTRSQYIAHAREIHGNAYDYSKLVYNGCRAVVTIICRIHGEFQQRAGSHLNCGHGCPQCGDQRKKVTMTDTTESFIAKARLRHGDRYDYSKTHYAGSSTKVVITCRRHGDFTQRPNNHVGGSNCPKCRGRHAAVMAPSIPGQPARHRIPMPIHPIDRLLRAARSAACETNTAA